TALTDQGGNIWNGTIIAQAGNHSVNVSASDAAGHVSWDNSTRYNASSVLQSQISESISSTSGGDGCGRNVNTNEKYSNVKQHEYSKEIDVHISKSTIAFYFKTLGIVTQAGFIPKTTEGCITALGEILKGRPSQASSDVPYQDATYFNVWVGPLGYSESSYVENQYLVFKKSDVKDDEIVKLMMYKDGAWNEVRTEKLSEGTYKAYTQGFGSFAIVKTQASTMTTQPDVTDIPGENKGMEPVNLALIIGVFLVILIGVIYYLKIR
ncbi:MAG: PGF-pre-PGF domain-containing protein, partial [Candidatus Methanoperedens sp.]|nr:PGF-pre-PGF domain-containing protein [Candidatus Methanoperedens sp.]